MQIAVHMRRISIDKVTVEKVRRKNEQLPFLERKIWLLVCLWHTLEDPRTNLNGTVPVTLGSNMQYHM